MYGYNGGGFVTLALYLRLTQIKALEPMVVMVHSLLLHCTAGPLRPLWNVSTGHTAQTYVCVLCACVHTCL